MRRKLIVLCFLVFSVIIFGQKRALAQFTFGPKVGISAFNTFYHSDEYLGDPNPLFDRIKPQVNLGYNIGAVMIYSVKDKFSLHTELLYTKSGKKLTGGKPRVGDAGGEGYFLHEANYHYLEVPFLFRVSYPNKKKTYQFYWNVGGNFKYWLSGSGTIRSAEYQDDHGKVEDHVDYKINFGYADPIEEGIIAISEPNRMQVGLDAGIGFLLNMPHPKHVLMLDLKFQYGHSWFGNDYGIENNIGLGEYKEDFRASNYYLTFSVGYLFNQNKGEHRKGKSTQDRNIRKAKSKKRR